MPEAPVSIFGGLPVIAVVSFTRDYYGECDADVDELYWMKRDGSKGKALPQHLFDKATADYKSADIIEQVIEHLAGAEYEAQAAVTLLDNPLDSRSATPLSANP